MARGGECAEDDGLFGCANAQYQCLGKTGKRKKVVSYIGREIPQATKEHYNKLHKIEEKLSREGVAMSVQPSWRLERLTWAMGVSLVAPLEVRSPQDLAEVATLARRLVLRQTTLAECFPQQAYDQTDWKREQQLEQRTPS